MHSTHRQLLQLITLLVILANVFTVYQIGDCHTYQSEQFTASANRAPENISLTQAEKDYLKQKKVIKMCVDPDWMPLEAIRNGKHIGMTSEYFSLIAQIINTPIELVPSRDWTESIRLAKSRKCDIFSLAMPTPERCIYMNFTRPYLSIPLVMAARNETPFIDNISLITDKKIGIVKGYAFNEILRKRFPKMQIIDVKSASDGLKQVTKGRLFGFIDTLATIGYSIQKDFIGELKVAGKFDERWELGIGARNDEPLLVKIFDKAIAAIPPQTHQHILNNWIAVHYDQKNNYKLVLRILLLLTIGLAILIWHNFCLRKLNHKLHAQNLKIQQQAEKLNQTEEKLRMQQKMEAVGLMAGGVAHDLNNILSAIINYPELILRKLPEESPLIRPVAAIKNSGQRAAEIVADMLTITRGAAAVKEVISINQEIENILHSPEITSLSENHPGIKLTVIPNEMPLNIKGSDVHIRRVLTNLIINAYEAIPGSGTIAISSSLIEINEPDRQNNLTRPGKYVVISIKDSGPGISVTDQAHIFEPFYSKKSMGLSGTGLGLAIVWNVIEDHNGKVTVASNDKGTIFTIYLPAVSEKIQEETKDSEKNQAASIAQLQGHRETILIVDDEEIQRDIASELLDSLNYKTLTASSGEEGIETLKREKPALVILDMLMEPGINGRETYVRMSEIQPGLKAVIASGFSENSEVEKALRSGPSIFIKKPYTTQHLGEVVKKLLQRKS